MRRIALVAVGLVLLTGCAASHDPGAGEVVAAEGPAENPAGEAAGAVEILQGTVTGVADAGDRLQLLVRLAWAPVLRAENRTVEVHIGPHTRFVPPGYGSRLHEGDDVQVRLPMGEPDRPHATEIAVLDLD